LLFFLSFFLITYIMQVKNHSYYILYYKNAATEGAAEGAAAEGAAVGSAC
jgi:hypothetical protein